MLLDFDDHLLAIEMEIVRPPFLLDFGKVYLDRPPPYADDTQLMATAHAAGKELIGKRWSQVLRVLAALQRFGIYYVDPKPANIDFGQGD